MCWSALEGNLGRPLSESDIWATNWMVMWLTNTKIWKECSRWRDIRAQRLWGGHRRGLLGQRKEGRCGSFSGTTAVGEGGRGPEADHIGPFKTWWDVYFSLCTVARHCSVSRRIINLTYPLKRSCWCPVDLDGWGARGVRRLLWVVQARDDSSLGHCELILNFFVIFSGEWWEWERVNLDACSVVPRVKCAVLSLSIWSLTWKIIPSHSFPYWPWHP